MFARWLTALVVAIGLGVAALELSSCLAVERRAGTGAPASGLFTDAVEPELPIGAEIEHNEASAMPRFTQ